MSIFKADYVPDARDKELADLRRQVARLFGAANDILGTLDYMQDRGVRLGIPRGQIARLRLAVEAVEEAERIVGKAGPG